MILKLNLHLLEIQIIIVPLQQMKVFLVMPCFI
uniref:Uncharacterized protein n=1 Tax=Geladintestivirus 4 TaxID=3233136 RepID=A0AAU8MHD0_9CAUD